MSATTAPFLSVRFRRPSSLEDRGSVYVTSCAYIAIFTYAFRATSMALKLNDTFAEFEKAFVEFQVRNNVLLVTKATKTVQVVNSCLTPGLEWLKEELKCKRYLCLQTRWQCQDNRNWNSSPSKVSRIF